jgi:hypothetical protein
MTCLYCLRRTTLAGLEKAGTRGAVTRMSESGDVVILSRVFVGEPGLPFVDYVPLPVARGTRSIGKRVQVDGSYISTSTSKKPRPPTTHITSSMILGE